MNHKQPDTFLGTKVRSRLDTLGRIIRSLLWAGPAVVGYTVVIPLLARHLDQRVGLRWPLPDGLSVLVAAVLIPAGLAIAVTAVWSLTIEGSGTPNPIAPPRRLVTRGFYRWSRNPMMIGAWAFGLGLAFALRSPTLAAVYLLIVVVGILYVRYIEEPWMSKVFGEAYESYKARVPRWLVLLFCALVATVPASVDAQTQGFSLTLTGHPIIGEGRLRNRDRLEFRL